MNVLNLEKEVAITKSLLKNLLNYECFQGLGDQRVNNRTLDAAVSLIFTKPEQLTNLRYFLSNTKDSIDIAFNIQGGLNLFNFVQRFFYLFRRYIFSFFKLIFLPTYRIQVNSTKKINSYFNDA